MLKRLLLLALCVVLTVVSTACGGQEATEEQPTQTEESYPVTYVPNETVNRFILTFQQRSELSLQDITKGTAPDEYVMMLNDCQLSLTPTATGMGVMLFSEPGERGQEKLFTAFSHIAKAADKSCTTDQLDAAIAFMKKQAGSSSEPFRVCNEVKILSYAPSVQVGGSQTNHRLDLVLINYVQVESE